MNILPTMKSVRHAVLALFALLLPGSLASAVCILPTPLQQATFNPLITETVQPNPPISYGLVTMANVPPGYSVTNSNYIGWCMNPILGLTPGIAYNPIMYDTYDIIGLTGIGVPTANNVWNKINYILNHKPVGANASTIQAAIWRFINFSQPDENALVAGTYGYGFPAADLATINAIEADANANGASFVPGQGQVTGVYLDMPIPPQTIVRQPFLIEVVCNSTQTPLGQIGDFVWKDLNQDGIQQANEPGIGNVKVTLKDISNTVIATTTTAGNGGYLFTGLAAGTYTVTVDTASLSLAGCIPTTPIAPGSTTDNDSNDNPTTVVLLTATSVDLSVDFGYISAPAGSIGDLVWKDVNGNGIQDGSLVEPGIPNVKVSLYKNNVLLQTQLTDADGLYLFTGLQAGTYSVVVDNTSPALAGCTPTTVNAPNSTLFNDSNPNPSVVVLPLNTSSDTSVDFGYKVIPAGRIGDFIWKDLNGNGIQDGGEPGIANVPVTLETSVGVVVAATVTNSVGYYQFTGLAAGTYVVIVDESVPALLNCVPTTIGAPGSTLANDSNPNHAYVILLTNSSSDQTIDFGYVSIPPPTGSIGNFVWKDNNNNGMQDSNEPGIGGVTVKLLGPSNVLLATQTTTSAGAYLFTGLKAGTYTVVVDNASPALAGCVPTIVNAGGTTTANDSNPNPATVVLATNSSTDLTIDFGYIVAPTGSIGNFVWKDLNANGIQETGEPGVGGVTVTLRNSSNVIISTKVTAINGSYLFTGLKSGTYTVTVDNNSPALAGCVPTIVAAAGSTTANDSNPNPSTVTLPTNSSNNLTIDFGYRVPPPPGGFITYTQGGWGAPPHGSNPGAFLLRYFGTVYPNGLTLGGTKTAKFTTAKAIENFLPSGGTPAPLSVSVVNPTNALGTLIGQALSVRLAVDFSKAGVTPAGLVNAKFVSGKFAGKTVGYVLTLAEQVIGGAALPSGISYANISDALTIVNENYDAGINLGNLIP